METSSDVLGKAFMHSVYVRSNNNTEGDDALVISELTYRKDGDVVPTLRIIENPKRTIYITKQHYRNHDEKKEREEIKKCDQYVIPNKNMDEEVHFRLNGYKKKSGRYDRVMYNNPYIYGCSATIEFLEKCKYQDEFEKTNLKLSGYTSGFLDIETDVNEDHLDEIISIVYTHKNIVYAGVVKSYFMQWHDDTQSYTQCDIHTLENIASSLLNELVETLFETNKFLKKHKSFLPFEYHYHVADNAVDLIRWIFSKIHYHKTTFIGIWNMEFDMKHILNTLRDAGVDPKEILCHPDVPDKYKYVYYQEDKRQVAHIAEKFDWCHISGYTQIYDSMPVYVQLRSKKETSYKLDHILEVNKITTKLKYTIPGHDNIQAGNTDWHRMMVKYEIYHYMTYMMWDAMSMVCMDIQNKDINTFYLLSGPTPLHKGTKQTIRNHDDIYRILIKKNWIVATGNGYVEEQKKGKDKGKKGGAVLNPYLLEDVGLKLYKNTAPQVTTYAYGHVNDLDFSRMYPALLISLNTSKETKQSVMIGFDNLPEIEALPKIETLHVFLANPESNCISLGSEFFGLPTLSEMLSIFQEQSI